MDMEILDWSDYAKLLRRALDELERAADRLLEPTVPQTPLPRPHIYELVPGSVYWPVVLESGEVDYRSVTIAGYTRRLGWLTGDEIVNKVWRYSGGQPRRVLHVLRRIEAATEWARKRREGRERAARAIVAAQGHASEELIARLALRALTQ